MQLTLETAGCAEERLVELSSPESVRATRATDPEAFGPTSLRELLQGNAPAKVAGKPGSPQCFGPSSGESSSTRSSLTLSRRASMLAARLGSSTALAGWMRAVRIAGVWFLESETHAMPDSYCEG